jgi:hypothetical protein
MFRKVKWLLGLFVCIFLVSSAITQSVSVSLAWSPSTDNVGVAGYHVYRNEVLIGTSSTTSFTDTTASPSTQYSYTVRAFDAAGNESGDSLPAVILTGTIITIGGGNDNTFTPTALRFMSPSGSDAANGLTPATAWATPNHAMNCGDVILAASGTYTTQFAGSWGTVSNCPSTTGGIDGTGGIWFAAIVCAGPDLVSCPLNSTSTGGSNGVVAPTTNNWSVQGFKVTVAGGADRGFAINPPNQTTILHHYAFINNVVFNTNQAFGGNDCPGGTCNHNVPGDGFDYWAIIGNIAQNSAQDGICLGAIDAVGVANQDTLPGTHIYVFNNFAISNNTADNGCVIDEEGSMFDTWDAHGYANQGVIANNIVYNSIRYGFQMFSQSFNTSSPTIKVYNNTYFNNLQQTGTDSADGELNWSFSSNGGSIAGWTFSVLRNIAYNTHATSPGGTTHNPVYAAVIGGTTWSNFTFGSTGNENVLLGSATSCAGTCDSGVAPFTISNFNSNGLGTNFITNPNFANTTDLFANHLGVPDCTGFENVSQCMGWDARNHSLFPLSVISDLTAGCAQCTGKGFQRPDIVCAPNPDYPAWLKGMNYLHALDGFTAGSRIVEKMGLTTKPCGM